MEKKCQSAPNSFMHKSSQTTNRHPFIRYPTFSSLTRESFERAVNFKSKSRGLCRSSWYSDIKALHVRNKSILELPFLKPTCCSQTYNILIDRKRKKKLQKFGLTREVRKRNSLEMEKIERCIPLEEVEKPIITRFPECSECYTLFECSSSEERDDDDEDDDDDDEDDTDYEECVEVEVKNDEKSESKRDSSSETTECICKPIKKRPKDFVQKWKQLLHVDGRQLCEDALAIELKKLRLEMKLRKVI